MKIFTTLLIVVCCLGSSNQLVAQKTKSEVALFKLNVINGEKLSDIIAPTIKYLKDKDDLVFMPTDDSVRIYSSPAVLSQFKKIIKFYDRALSGDESIQVYGIQKPKREMLLDSIKRALKNSSSFEVETCMDGCLVVKGSELDHEVFCEIRALIKKVSIDKKK